MPANNQPGYNPQGQPGGFGGFSNIQDERRRQIQTQIQQQMQHGNDRIARMIEENKKKKENNPINVLHRQLTADAKKSRSNISSDVERQYQGLLPDYNKALDLGDRGVREEAARRGMGTSGFLQRKEGDLRSGLASQLAQSRYNIQKEQEALVTKKETAAAGVGLADMQARQQRAEDYQMLSDANQVERTKAFGLLAQGIGYGVGAYYGGKDPNDPNAAWNSARLRGQNSSFWSGMSAPSPYGGLLGVNYYNYGNGRQP